MRAWCKGRLDYGGRTHRFEAAFALKPPDRLYAEISGPIGAPRAILAIRGDRLLLLLPRARSFLEEKATPEVYEALIGMGIDSKTFIAVLGSGGRPGAWKAGTAAASGPVVDLLIRSDGRKVRVSASGGAPGGFEGLVLRFRDLERPPRRMIEDGLFDPPIPTGWERIRLPGGEPARPILLP